MYLWFVWWEYILGKYGRMGKGDIYLLFFFPISVQNPNYPFFFLVGRNLSKVTHVLTLIVKKTIKQTKSSNTNKRHTNDSENMLL